jgi:hypothetical protein
MLFKEDWDECRHWQAAWLRGEDAAHWALGVLAPRERPIAVPPPPPRPQDPRLAWLDYEGNLARAQVSFANTFWGGIDHPYLTANIGPGSLSLFLGARPGFGNDTVWHQPCFQDPATVALALDSDNEYWQWTLKALVYLKAAARDRFLVAMPDLTSGLDCLAQLFGTEPLLMFLLECPQEIHRLLREVEEIHDRVYDELRKIVVDEDGGNAGVSNLGPRPDTGHAMRFFGYDLAGDVCRVRRAGAGAPVRPGGSQRLSPGRAGRPSASALAARCS